MVHTSLYQELKKAGIEIDHHESDLYFPVNDITRALVDQYEFKGNVTRFISAHDGKVWFDAPFAYDPFWKGKGV